MVPIQLELNKYYINGHGAIVKIVNEITPESPFHPMGFRFKDEWNVMYDDYGSISAGRRPSVDDILYKAPDKLSWFQRFNLKYRSFVGKYLLQ